MQGTVATKYSRIHATAGHTRIPSPFAKYFGWFSRLCSLFHPRHGHNNWTTRDENHDPKGKWQREIRADTLEKEGNF